jgi:exopolysaccharide production protein ExoZ
MSMSKLAGDRLYGLQILRFFAAFSVLFAHTLHELHTFGGVSAPPEPFYLADGVDVFFVISGFIMYYISAGQFGVAHAQRSFLTKRLIRLVPLYWFFTALMVVAVVLVPTALAHDGLAIPHVAASFAFIPWLDSTGLVHPVLGLGWTLNYEMFFYVAFSFALWLTPRLGLVVLLAAFLALAALNAWVDPQLVQLKFWTDPIILEFLFGVGVAAVLIHGLRAPAWAPALLMVAGLAGLALGILLPGVDGFARPLLVGVPATMLVAGAAFGRFDVQHPVSRFLVLGGDASYALYLSHPFSINLVEIVWKRLHLSPGPVFVAVALVAAVAASIVVHLILERPVTRWLNFKLVGRSRGADARRTRPAVNAGE